MRQPTQGQGRAKLPQLVGVVRSLRLGSELEHDRGSDRQGRDAGIDIAVIGIDPGEITGVFLLYLQLLDLDVLRQIHQGVEVEQQGVTEVVSDILDYTSLAQIPVSIAAERFVITARAGRNTHQPAALEVIGAMRDLAGRRRIPFTLHNRSDVIKLADDSVLRSLGWFTRTRDGHANDGARQALSELAQVHPLMFQKLMQDAKLLG